MFCQEDSTKLLHGRLVRGQDATERTLRRRGCGTD